MTVTEHATVAAASVPAVSVPATLPATDWAEKFHSGQVGFAPLQEDLLTTLVQHRLMSTCQLHALLTPQARSREYLARQLRRLAAAGLVTSTPVQRTRNDKAWWVTPAGRAVVAGAVRHRHYVMTSDRAASPLQRHTLLTNQIGVECARHARAAGHHLGPLDWDNEFAHRMRDGDHEAATVVVSDLRLRFVMHDDQHGDLAVTRLVEADRGTEAIHALCDKVRAYARMLRYVTAESRRNGDTIPLWRRIYSTFPKLVIIFADRDPAWMRRRAHQLLELTAADPLLAQYLPQLGVLCTTMPALIDRGPFEPIFLNTRGDTVDIRDLTYPSAAGEITTDRADECRPANNIPGGESTAPGRRMAPRPTRGKSRQVGAGHGAAP